MLTHTVLRAHCKLHSCREVQVGSGLQSARRRMWKDGPLRWLLPSQHQTGSLLSAFPVCGTGAEMKFAALGLNAVFPGREQEGCPTWEK